MKLFALHGHLQNARKFKGQTNALMSKFKRMGVQIIFLDAPYECEGGEDPANPLRSWVKDESIEESRKSLAKAHEENPDVVGIFGFSMGSMLALHLAADAANNDDSPFTWIKIIVAVSSPYPSIDDPVQAPFMAGFPCRSEIPVLFVIGTTDQIAPPEVQRKYLEYFANNTIFEHEGGHYIPSAKQFLPKYEEFFNAHSVL